MKRTFDKEMFKRSVLYNVKTLFRKDITEATKQQIFQAVSYAAKDAIMDAWIATQKKYDEEDHGENRFYLGYGRCYRPWQPSARRCHRVCALADRKQ